MCRSTHNVFSRIMPFRLVCLVILIPVAAIAAPFTSDNSEYNLNRHGEAASPREYYGEWPGHEYYPSPVDWRGEVVYQLLTDRFSDGDPRNNQDRNGGFDVYRVDRRHGGDFRGLQQKLPYLKTLGITSIWISPLYQNGWNGYHGYGPHDFTLVDWRLGTLTEFREFVQAAHQEGIRVIADVIVNHLSNLYYFEGYKDGNAPFRMHAEEYRLKLRNPDLRYPDFRAVNKFIPTGKYCDVFNQWGVRHRDPDQGSNHASDFNHNGDLRNYLNPWELKYGKIYGGLDDLRLGSKKVQEKLIAMSKALIASTDVDGFRVDTPVQVPLCFFKEWVPAIREYARSLGKDNFGIFAETYTLNQQMGTILGRGREWIEVEEGALAAVMEPFLSDRPMFLGGINYPLFKSFIEPLLYFDREKLSYKAREVLSHQHTFLDLVDPSSGELRDQNWLFYNSHDQRRLCQRPFGRDRTRLGAALISILPGIPVHYQGDEQLLCSYGRGLQGHGRESMMASIAWQDLPVRDGTPSPSLDNFDMSDRMYLFMARLNRLRQSQPALTSSSQYRILDDESLSDSGLLVIERGNDTQTPLVAIFNLTESPSEEIEVKLSAGFGGKRLRSFATGNRGYVVPLDGRISMPQLTGFDFDVFYPADQAGSPPLFVEDFSPAHDSILKGKKLTTVTIGFTSAVDPKELRESIRMNGARLSEKVTISSEKNGRSFHFTIPVEEGLSTVSLDRSLQAIDGRSLSSEFRSRFFRLDDFREGTILSHMIQLPQEPLFRFRGNVDLPAPSIGASWYRISLDRGASWSSWKPRVDRIPVSLRSCDGLSEVQVQFWVDGSSAYIKRYFVDCFADDGFIPERSRFEEEFDSLREQAGFLKPHQPESIFVKKKQQDAGD